MLLHGSIWRSNERMTLVLDLLGVERLATKEYACMALEHDKYSLLTSPCM